MTNNATGSGMGTSGLVGQIMTYQTMVATESPVLVILKIVVFHFLLPGLLSYVIYRGMRNMGYIKRWTDEAECIKKVANTKKILTSNRC